MEEEEVTIRNLGKELEALGFDYEQSNKILEWVDTIPIRIYGGENINVVVNKGAVVINSQAIDPNDLSFNLLDKQTRINFLWDTGKFNNPFKLPKDIILFNPFTGIPIRPDGKPVNLGNTVHYMHNVFNCKLFAKIEYQEGKPIKLWHVNDQNEWVEEELRKE